MLTKAHKWTLFTCVLISLGFYYTIDWPATLETPLKEPPYSLTSVQYNMIYFSTMLPMALFSIPLGMLIDRIQLKSSIWIFLGGQIVTQVLMSIVFLMARKEVYVLIIVLRVVYGLTTESVFTIQSVIVERTMPKKYIDIALNLCYTAPMPFQALNSVLGTQVYERTGQMYLVVLIGVPFCVLSLLAGLYSVRNLRKEQEPMESNSVQTGQIGRVEGEVEGNRSEDDKIEQSNESSLDSSDGQEKCNLADIKHFSWQFWLFSFVLLIGQASLAPFIDNLTDLLVKRFNVPYTTSGALSMIPCGISPIFSLIWYWLLNKFPHKRRLIFLVIAIQVFCVHLVIILIPRSPEPTYVQYILISLSLLNFSSAFSGFIGTMQVSITMIVPKRLIGTAYGTIGGMDALSMCLMPILNGLIVGTGGQDERLGYLRLSYLYISLSGGFLTLTAYICGSRSKQYMKFNEIRGDSVIGDEGVSKQSLIDHSFYQSPAGKSQ